LADELHAHLDDLTSRDPRAIHADVSRRTKGRTEGNTRREQQLTRGYAAMSTAFVGADVA
jgi:hypothetical protein